MTARRSPTWSTETTVNHTFTQPGVYYVTVTAIDDRGVPVSQTFVQAVHLPLTANRADGFDATSRSGAARGGNRVWVVNQDNDTASVFNAVDQREDRRDHRRRRAAQRRGRAERPDLGDEQAGRFDQHDRPDVARSRADARAAARFAAVRHRVRPDGQCGVRRVRGAAAGC